MRGGASGVAGPLVKITAVGHAVVGVFLFSEPLSEMTREGFINSIRPPMYSVQPHFDRAAAFWFLLFSPVLFLLGQIINHAVAHGDTRSLRLIGWYLIGIGAVGAAILPLSGNWLLLPLGAIILKAAHTVAAAS
jgi:Family of unknown function (DUF6463)